jgi:hypothetical protein
LRSEALEAWLSSKEGWLMANLEKHKRNLVYEFLGGEEATEAAQSRSIHVIGAHGKAIKAVPRRRPPVQNGQAKKPDPALVREAAPLKMEEKHSQASAPEHLRRLQRISNLRAPYGRRG